jgi:tetratricopeptide (TPR) repeat protein
LGDAELGLGNFDAAIDEYRKAIDAGWRAYQPYRGLAAAYALEGKMEEAASALAEARSRAHSRVAANRFTKYRAGSGCLDRFPRTISGVLPGLLSLPHRGWDEGRA